MGTRGAVPAHVLPAAVDGDVLVEMEECVWCFVEDAESPGRGLALLLQEPTPPLRLLCSFIRLPGASSQMQIKHDGTHTCVCVCVENKQSSVQVYYR